jgi:anaerobic ribonucleoside-triphosphate reductase activating protein
MSVEDLAEKILRETGTNGLTISGGEPTHQAPALTRLIDLVNQQRPDFTFISYSGYLISELHREPQRPGVEEYLKRLDVLIDGPYVRELDNGVRGLKGSANQVVHHLSGRLQHFDFDNAPRHPEIRVQDQQIMFVGIPSRHFLEGFEGAVCSVRQLEYKLVENVRS